MEDANFKIKRDTYISRMKELDIKIRKMEADGNCDARELWSLKNSLSRLSANFARLTVKMANELQWEERRFSLVKETLDCVLSDPNCQMTPEQIADTVVAVADAVITKMQQPKV